MIRSLVLLVALTVPIVIGCSGNPGTTHSSAWTITIGSGGGFTGGSSGYIIESSGSVTHWSTASASSAKQSTTEPDIDPSDAAVFKRYLDRVRFDTITSGPSGNMTEFVELVEGSSTHRASWAAGPHAPNAGLMNLQRFYDFVQSYLASQKG